MSVFTDDTGPASAPEVEKQEDEVKSFDTDVEGVTSNDVVNFNGADYPCFDVTDNEFHQNMDSGRRRLRFKSGTNTQKYMSGTKYARAFYIRTTDSNGKTMQRKIK
jgi:hypothetical protein